MMLPVMEKKNMASERPSHFVCWFFTSWGMREPMSAGDGTSAVYKDQREDKFSYVQVAALIQPNVWLFHSYLSARSAPSPPSFPPGAGPARLFSIQAKTPAPPTDARASV